MTVSQTKTEPSEVARSSVVELVGRAVASSEVYSIVHGGRTILLDLRTERYLGLDEVGTAVWLLIKQAGDGGIVVSELVDSVAAECSAQQGLLKGDLVALLDNLRQVGVIEGISRADVVPNARAPSALRCAITLAAAALTLRVLGLRRALAIARWMARQVPPVAQPTMQILELSARRIRTAAAFLPCRVLCLEQSLATYLVLRRSGIGVRLRLGAQPYPFAAHAWVEYEGEPVSDDLDRVAMFVPFDDLRLQ